MKVVWDIETYPNCFTLAAEHVDLPIRWSFEISDWVDDGDKLREWLRKVTLMVGFNNLGFDYPVLHTFIRMGKVTAKDLYDKSQAIIASQDGDRFAHLVYPSDRHVPQLDLYKIHHFDNKARATGLKALEFVMRADNISDLPFPVGTYLKPEHTVELRRYNAHDVAMTKKFYHLSKEMIDFREALTQKYARDFMNDSDVKIGKEIFRINLEAKGVECYTRGISGRQPKQTKRPTIPLAQCVPSFVKFQHPEFERVRQWLSEQNISDTKGVFNDLEANVGGLTFVFGTGGLHASAENKTFVADEHRMILDIDVTSLYPSIAIEHGHYPEHLGQEFVNVYRELREQRLMHKKGTPENAMLKLALNGVYGASGDMFSIFYDPLFTMKITIGGQLMIAMLAERLTNVPTLRLIQVNTDGITMMLDRERHHEVKAICDYWSKETHLELEHAEYTKMCIADVNSYIACKPNGEVKRKGRYEYKREWHKDHSFMVIPKVAEKVLLEGVPIRQTVESWPDLFDFFGRIKVNRTSSLVLEQDGTEVELDKTQRYYVSQEGGHMVKIMPPLKGKTENRRFSVESGWKVCPCNDVKEAILPVNFDYYVAEVEKLVMGVI